MTVIHFKCWHKEGDRERYSDDTLSNKLNGGLSFNFFPHLRWHTALQLSCPGLFWEPYLRSLHVNTEIIMLSSSRMMIRGNDKICRIHLSDRAMIGIHSALGSLSSPSTSTQQINQSLLDNNRSWCYKLNAFRVLNESPVRCTGIQIQGEIVLSCRQKMLSVTRSCVFMRTRNSLPISGVTHLLCTL